LSTVIFPDVGFWDLCLSSLELSHKARCQITQAWSHCWLQQGRGNIWKKSNRLVFFQTWWETWIFKFTVSRTIIDLKNDKENPQFYNL
jgi:hypothetical protein